MTWHPEGIYFKEESWFIQGHSRMGNQSLSGRRQRVGALAERWRATITLHVPEAKRLDWRAWLAKRRGTMVPAGLKWLAHFQATGGPRVSSELGGFSTK